MPLQPGQRSNSGWDVASAVMLGAINFNDADIKVKRAGLRSARATAGVRQRVGRGRGRPKAASVLSTRWRLGAVTTSTFIDISQTAAVHAFDHYLLPVHACISAYR